jgi:hypothetical protein
MSDIINLNGARKERARKRKEEVASRNRAKFGRTKAEVARETHRQFVDSAKLCGHVRDATPPAVELMPTCSADAPCEPLDNPREAAFDGAQHLEASTCLPCRPGGDDFSVIDAGEMDTSDEGSGR